MPMFQPPKQFVETLHRFDPLLRVRWSDRECVWRIERKITRSRPVPANLFSDPDDYLMARDGYCYVLKCGKEQLDSRVFYTLWMSDIARRGGYAKMADELDAHDLKQRDTSSWADDQAYRAKEYFNYINAVHTVPEHLHATAKNLSINNT